MMEGCSSSARAAAGTTTSNWWRRTAKADARASECWRPWAGEDQLDRAQLRRLAQQLVAWAEDRPDVEPSAVDVAASREVGRLMLLEHPWQQLELDRILADQLRGRRFGFDVATVIQAIVFGRVIEPSSERALVREWLRRVR